MATENEKYSFIETLNKFRNGEVIEISDILKKRDMLQIETILDAVQLRLSLLKSENLDDSQYEVKKQMIRFFYGLLQCTSLELGENDIDILNYDLEFESYILSFSVVGRKVYEMVDNIIEKERDKIIEELSTQFKTFPSVEETQKLEKEMDKMFEKRSSGDLKFIENILQYNNPTLKLIKDMLESPVDNVKTGVGKNGDNITKR